MIYLTSYRGLKQSLIDQLSISDATAHIHTGLLIYLFIAFIMRKRLHSAAAIGAVVVSALLNEAVDSAAGGATGNPIPDVINTCMWPVAIFTLARVRHGRVLKTSRRHQELKRKLLDFEPRRSGVSSSILVAREHRKAA